MILRRQETRAFIEEHCPDWEVSDNDVVLLTGAGGEGKVGRRPVQQQLHAEKAISQTLAYASELERIV